MSSLASLLYAFPVFGIQNRPIATLAFDKCSVVFYEPNLGVLSPFIEFNEAFSALSGLFTEPVRAKAVVADFTDDGNPDALFVGWAPKGQSRTFVPVGVFTRWLSEEIACGLIPLSADIPVFIDQCAASICRETLFIQNAKPLTLGELPKVIPAASMMVTVSWRGDGNEHLGFCLSPEETEQYLSWCNGILTVAEKIQKRIGKSVIRLNACGIDWMHRYLFMHWQTSCYPESNAVLSWVKAFGSQDPYRLKEALLDPDIYRVGAFLDANTFNPNRAVVEITPRVFHFLSQ